MRGPGLQLQHEIVPSPVFAPTLFEKFYLIKQLYLKIWTWPGNHISPNLNGQLLSVQIPVYVYYFSVKIHQKHLGPVLFVNIYTRHKANNMSDVTCISLTYIHIISLKLTYGYLTFIIMFIYTVCICWVWLCCIKSLQNKDWNWSFHYLLMISDSVFVLVRIASRLLCEIL